MNSWFTKTLVKAEKNNTYKDLKKTGWLSAVLWLESKCWVGHINMEAWDYLQTLKASNKSWKGTVNQSRGAKTYFICLCLLMLQDNSLPIPICRQWREGWLRPGWPVHKSSKHVHCKLVDLFKCLIVVFLTSFIIFLRMPLVCCVSPICYFTGSTVCLSPYISTIDLDFFAQKLKRL